MERFILIGLAVLTGALLCLLRTGLFRGLRDRGRGKKPAPLKPASRERTPLPGSGLAGEAQTCPVCRARLAAGETVKSSVFPSFDGKERLMRLKGCVHCLNGERRRLCPVCGSALGTDETLTARMFERPGKRHVHVLGCSRCRGE
ncbi:MAG: hypothetical protein MdMp014T_1082 [Treponematales bacterium]